MLGDIILSVDGAKIKSGSDLYRVLDKRGVSCSVLLQEGHYPPCGGPGINRARGCCRRWQLVTAIAAMTPRPLTGSLYTAPYQC